MKQIISPLLQISLCTAGYLYASGNATLAQVTSDGTVNTQVNQNGNVTEITGGETRGDNLFHSFQDFSLATGNEAFFNNTSDISNIFSRVTGGNISNIDGLIRANGSASLFLINPAGIIFGENARLDIGGSFYGSTASSILFDGGEFSAADLENPPLLTINAPIGLGFRDNPGDIVNRSTVQNSAEEVIGLEVDPGNNLTFIAGNLNFEGGNLTASGGDIYLGAISESGTVEINDNGSGSFAEDVLRGDITLTNGSEIDVRGSGGGNIQVDVRNLNLEGGELGISSIRGGIREESTAIEAQAGDITINATGSIFLNEGEIINNVDRESIGNSGNVFVTTSSLFLLNGSVVASITLGQGNAGAVNVTATEDITADGEKLDGLPSGIFSTVDIDVIDRSATGNSGSITISTNNLTLTNGGRVDASTFGHGDAGQVNVTATGDIIADGEKLDGLPSGIFSTVDATVNSPEERNAIERSVIGNSEGITISTNNLTLTNGARVDASTLAQGNAGQVNVTATGDIISEGETSGNHVSGITSRVFPFGVGNSGGVTVFTNNLNLTNGGRVDASSGGQGNAGQVNVIATGDTNIDGRSPSRRIPSGIKSRVNGNFRGGAVGNSGGVTVFSNNLNLTNGGEISASTLARGNAGQVNVTATGNINIDGKNSEGTPSGITSTVEPDLSRDPEGKTSVEGNSGGVTVSTNNLNLTNGGRVSATTEVQGNAGPVNVIATGDINIDGKNSEGTPSGITSTVEPDAEGDAGGVTVFTNNLNLTSGGRVSATTEGQGNANNVTIEATESITIDGFIEGFRSGIFANALNQNGNGGDVFINTGKLSVANGGTVEATNFDNVGEQNPGAGRPGSINIIADIIELTNNARIETVTQFPGEESGIINLQVAEDITLKNNSFISAQAFNNADGGNLTINARFILGFPSEGTGNDLIASAEKGDGGNINLNIKQLFGFGSQQRIATDDDNNFLSNNTNDLDVSGSVEGDLNINITNVDPLIGTIKLAENLVTPGKTSQQACQANRESAAQNGLNITGKGGITPDPGNPLNSLNTYVDDESTLGKSIPAPIETSKGKIQPARGIKVTESGEIILTAYRTNDAGDRLTEGYINCDRV